MARTQTIAALARLILIALVAFFFTLAYYLGFQMALCFGQRGGRFGAHFIRNWAKLMLKIGGVRLKVRHPERLPRRGPCLVAATHASALDIPVLLAAFPGWLTMVAKESLGKMLLIGSFLRKTGHILINRANARQSRDTLLSAATRIHNEQLIVLAFPEGTRSRDGRLQPLKEGTFYLACVANLPVLPVVIAQTHELMPRSVIAPLRSGIVELRVGERLEPNGLDRSAMAERTQQAFLALGAMR